MRFATLSRSVYQCIVDAEDKRAGNKCIEVCEKVEKR